MECICNDDVFFHDPSCPMSSFQRKRKMYTKGEIIEAQVGWELEIKDPQGDVISTVQYGWDGMKFTDYVKEMLNQKADSLLSHLNRGSGILYEG